MEMERVAGEEKEIVSEKCANDGGKDSWPTPEKKCTERRGEQEKEQPRRIAQARVKNPANEESDEGEPQGATVRREGMTKHRPMSGGRCFRRWQFG